MCRDPEDQENEWKSSAAGNGGRGRIFRTSQTQEMGRLPGVNAVRLVKIPNSRDIEPEKATSCNQAGPPVEG